MTFWKKLFGIKELPKADLTKKNQTRPSVTSKPQAPQAVGAKEDAPEFTEKLGEAARTGDVTEIRNLLNNGAIVNARTRDGVTALHSAAMFGHKAVAELLLANGANVNAKNSYGETPLERAVRYLNKCSNKETVELLRRRGGRIIGTSDRGYYQRCLSKDFDPPEVALPGWFDG